jgi:hypothetical protein
MRTPDDATIRIDYNVTPEKFIEVWQTSSSADEVASKLGMPKPIVHARASNYRALGVALKSMPRPKKSRLDVRELNAIIARLKQQQDDTRAQPASADPQALSALVVPKLHTE